MSKPRTTSAAAPPPSDPPAPEQSAPVLPTMVEIVAALLADEGFHAVVLDGLRTIVPGADEMVPAILASEDFVPGLKSLVDSHLDTVLPGEIEKNLAGRPFLMGADFGAEPSFAAFAPVKETSIERTAKGQANAAKAAARLAEERAQQRAEGELQARASYLALIETVPETVEPIDLLTVVAAALALDNGTALSVDYSLPIAPADLSLDDSGAVRLRHEPIAIGDGMDTSFPVKGVVLILQGEEGMRAVRCEMPSTLMVGGGQRAQLGADSLIFRIPR